MELGGVSVVVARCALCGKRAEVPRDHKDYRRFEEAEEDERRRMIYVCDICSHRVRYESDNQLKPKKPM